MTLTAIMKTISIVKAAIKILIPVILLIITLKAGSEDYFDRWAAEQRQALADSTRAAALVHAKPVREVPCVNAATGRANPLAEMHIASTGAGGYHMTGGTFGNTRHNGDGSERFHGGNDFLAEEGTPVFATHDGIIEGGAAYVTGQPNRVRDKDGDWTYPEGYAGNTGDYGNHVSVKYKDERGNNVEVLYAHLLAGNSAIVKPGQRVKAGELIGYTGRTGNAAGVPNAHLHFEVRVNGIRQDSSQYMNGTVNRTSGEVTEIRC